MASKSTILTYIFLLANLTLFAAKPLPIENIKPGSDDSASFLNAIEKVRRAGGGIINFERGEYRFSTKAATELSFNISNHNQTDPHAVALALTGLTNVTVRGNGSLFLVDGAAIGFAIIDSENIRLEGISLDWTRPFISEAVIDGFENGKTRIKVDPVKFPHVHSNDCFYATGTDWTLPVRYLIVSRADSRALVEGTTDYLWKGRPMPKVAPYTYLMDIDFSKKGAGARKGDIIALRSPGRTCPGVVVYRAKNTTLEDVSIHSSWGMGVICQFSENFTWRGTRNASERKAGVFARKETGRIFSANADASHFSNVKGKIIEENLFFENMMDDAINVHATSVEITEIIAPKTLRCRFKHNDAYGFELFRTGERLRFIKGKTLENGPSIKVESFRLDTDHDMTIVLKYPIPNGFGVGDAVENAQYQPEVIFRNNIVARNRARGALFTTAGRVCIESNLFENVSGSALLFSGDAQGWYESGGCREVLIRGNTFRSCNKSYFQFCDGIISFSPVVRNIAEQKRAYHRGITICDNVFETFKTPLLYARSVENLVFSGNKVLYNDSYQWNRPYKGEIVTEYCKNIKNDCGETEPMIWGALLHLGTNMWWDEPQDHENPIDRNWTSCAKDYLDFDEDVWKEVTDEMVKSGMNLIIIDIGDALAFPSHPELAIKGSWTPEKLRAEVERLRSIGLEPIPKLNFSTCHDIWLKKYHRMISTPEYYKVCADVIKDVFDVFGNPRFFHIGYDEESDHPFQSYIALRKGDLWWHDFEFFVNEVEKHGSRPWIWSDYLWKHRNEFITRMPRKVMQSNWYYYQSFNLPEMKAQKNPHACELEGYGILEDAAYDQIPTGSNWDNNTNFINTVQYCAKRIAPCRLKGFLQTPWRITKREHRESLLESIRQVAQAKRWWDEVHTKELQK